MIRARALLLFALTLPAAARATGVDPAAATPVQREQAQARFVKGKQRYDAGDYNGALAEFQGSIDIVQSPNTRLYIARCYRELRRLVEAYVEFGRTMVEAKEHAAADGRYAKAAEAAQAERTAVEPYIGFVTFTISNANEETKLFVANSEIKRGGWTEPVPVMPGSTDVRLETPGHEPVRWQVAVQAGEKTTLPVDAGAAPVVKVPLPPPPPPPPPRSGGPLLPAAIGAFGVGALGFAIFGVAGGLSLGTYADLEKKCGKNTPCPPGLQGAVDRGKTEQTLANVGLVLGLIGVAAGGALLTVHLLPKSSSGSARLELGPEAITLRGAF